MTAVHQNEALDPKRLIRCPFQMKTKILATCLLSYLLFLWPASGHGEAEIRKDADDHFEIILNRSSDKPITVLQVTDLH